MPLSHLPIKETYRDLALEYLMSSQPLLGFSRNRQQGRAVKNLIEALQTEAVTYKLSVGREVRTEIPGKIDQRRDHELLRS